MKVEVIDKNSANKFLQKCSQNNIINYEVAVGLIDDEIKAIMCFKKSFINYVYFLDDYNTYDNFSVLYDYLRNYLISNEKYCDIIYTFKKYQEMFEKKKNAFVASSSNYSMLDSEKNSIVEEMLHLKKQVEGKFSIDVDHNDICAVIMKCDPFTNMHLDILEKLREKHQYVIVFILEGGNLMFSLQERLSMAYLATMAYNNIIVIPSLKYIFSNDSFPEYFGSVIPFEEKSQMDAKILRYFQRYLNINKFYFHKKNEYFDYLGQNFDDLCYIDSNYPDTASIRELIEQKKEVEVMSFIPNSNKTILRMIISSKLD